MVARRNQGSVGPRWQNFGVTLAEALISLFLFGLVLSIIPGIFQMVGQSSRLQEREETRSEAQQVLEQIRGELTGALEILVPSPGATGPRLSFRRLRASYRLPPQPVPPTWDRSSIEFDEVSYELQGGSLQRQVTGGPTRSFLKQNCLGFSAARLANENLLISLNLQEFVPVTIEVFLP